MIESLEYRKRNFETELPIKIEDKTLYTDIVDYDERKVYEVNGPHHYKIDGLTKITAKEKGITPEEQLAIQQKNDEDKAKYWENKGFEVIHINIEEYTILQMLKFIFNEEIERLPEIDFSKYIRLTNVPVVQKLINELKSVEQIADILGISRRTIYNYIDYELVTIPEDSPIGKKLDSNDTKRIQEDTKLVQNLANKKYTVKQIKSETNISEKRIREYLKDFTLPEDSPIRQGREKAVVCLTTNEEFNSITEAEEKYGIKQIGESCNLNIYFKGTEPKTGAPLIWRYKEDYDKLTKQEIDKIIGYVINNCKNMNRKIICIDTKDVFNAEDFSKAELKNIGACCRFKQKTAGGYRWMYYDQYLWSNNLLYETIMGR